MLAADMGMKENNMLICEIGDTVELTAKSMRRAESFPAGSRLIDGLNIDEDATSTVRDRVHLSEDGVIVAVCCVSAESGVPIQEPSLICKGVALTEAQTLDCKNIILKTIADFDIKIGDNPVFRHQIRRSLKNYIFKKTKHNPIILPVITEI